MKLYFYNLFTVFRMNTKSALSLLFIGASLSVNAQINPTNNIVYVSPEGTGDGSSWQTSTNLADALKWAKSSSSWDTNNVLQLWLKEGGNYVPKYRGNDLSFNTSNTPLRTFVLVKNVQIYGGFKGTETSLEELNNSTSKSIISGDINGDDIYNIGATNHDFRNSEDNATHVFVGSNDLGNSILYNLIIQGSNGYSSGDYSVNGQGINNQYGGGIYLDKARLSVQNSIIRYNKTRQRGAGVYIENGAKGYFQNVLFAFNQANTNDGDGGAIFIKGGPSSELHVQNSTIVRNYASDGGGIRIDGTETVKIYNSIIYDNNVKNSGASISQNSGSTNYTNILNNIIAGVNSSNNFNNAPGYDADFKLTPSSFAYNKGNNTYYTALNNFSAPSLDLASGNRFNGTIDLGAYEYNIPLGLGEVQINKLEVYPTNFSNQLTVKNNSEIKSVTITSINGQSVLKQDVNKSDIILNTNSLSKGVYIISIETEQGIKTKKIIKK